MARPFPAAAKTLSPHQLLLPPPLATFVVSPWTRELFNRLEERERELLHTSYSCREGARFFAMDRCVAISYLLKIRPVPAPILAALSVE